MTRDEQNNPIPDLAASVAEAPDKLSYTFTLRTGIKFHNGKPMTSEDVAASFDRYSKLGLEHSMFANVENWEATNPGTFVIRMKKPQPTFIETLSSFSVPIVIHPSEARDDAVLRLRTIGTGPFMLDEFVPGGFVRIKRYDGYVPNTAYEQRTGFGGYRVACLDSVTFRIVTEASARVAGLQTGELQAVEDVPTKSLAALKGDAKIRLLPLLNWWVQIATVNVQKPPTDNLAFRRAVQAALDVEEVMEAATDGNFRLNVGFQYPGRAGYTDAGKATYNIKDPARAKALLKEAGYTNQPVTILTNKDYSSMYNAAVVMAEQMKAVGINAQLQVVDWPTSVNMQLRGDTGWNFFHSGYGTQPALGPLSIMGFFAPPEAVYRPLKGQDDPDIVAAWNDMNTLPDQAARDAAYARMQTVILERVYALPFGSLTKVQASRSNVENFTPFRIPRMSNVWLSN